MKILSKKSSFRSAVSIMLSLSMLLSLIVIPAFGAIPAVPSAYVTGSLVAGGTGLTSVVEAGYTEGLVGTVTVDTSSTPYLPAEILLQPLGNPTLGGSTVANDPTALTLHIAATGVGGSVLTTDVVCQASDTFDAVLARINAQVGAASTVADDVKVFAGRKGDFNQPYFRLQKAGGGSSLSIWDDYTATVLQKGVADLLVFGPASVTEFRDTNNGARITGFGSDGSGFTDPPNGWSFKPVLGTKFATETITYGSWREGVVGSANWQSIVDTMSGQYTAIMLNNGAGITGYLSTGSRTASVGKGQLTFLLGAGDRAPAVNYGLSIIPNTGDPKVGAVVAGKTETFTVTAPLPTPAGDWAGLENAYNGVRVLYPKQFTFAASPNVTSSADPAGQSVVTSNTAYGPMVTVTGFVAAAGSTDITVRSTLVATTTAGVYNTVKVWVRNVGTDGEKWVPLFCPPPNNPEGNAPMAIQVAPEVVSKVELQAEKNRAAGKTLLRAIAYDKYNNKVPNPSFVIPTVTGTSDGAVIAATSSANEWIWTLAKTAGANKATLTYASVTGSLTVDTTGIGEPAKVMVVPVDADGRHFGAPVTTWDTGKTPAFFMQLVDANGNPTSFLYTGDRPRLFSATMASVSGVIEDASAYIHTGWSRSSSWSGEGAPEAFNFMVYDYNLGYDVALAGKGPDVWTLTGRSNGGLADHDNFSTITIRAADPTLVGVPDHLMVSAVATAPAEYAEGDNIYNDKSDNYADSAFGYARGDGTQSVAFTARVVDKYNTPVTNSALVGNIKVTFSIANEYGAVGVLPTGNIFTTNTDASGVATTTVKSYRATFHTFSRSEFEYDQSWFTPVKAEIALKTGATDWANPCTTDVKPTGYGFAYFHGGEMTADLEQTPECSDKDVLLADGTDSAKYEAYVEDPAFLTPVANWPVKFTTNFGSFDASGTKAVETTTGADGRASVTIKSSIANDEKTPYATLIAIDRQGETDVETVTFTDWKTVAQVLEPTKRAGDRAYAKVRVSYENFKTGAKFMWDKKDGQFSNETAEVYDGQIVCASCHDDLPANAAKSCAWYTNDTEWASKAETDTNADGKYDSVDILIPAKDVMGYTGAYQESAGKRYAVVGGQVSARAWIGTVFYNQKTIVAAYARPEVNFVKEATLSAEGTQFSTGMSITGTKFTPGTGAPDFSDCVDIYLGDITIFDTETNADTYGTKLIAGHGKPDEVDHLVIGKAYVGRDGSLLPVVAASDYMRQMSPGKYDITVDGLVFKQGLEIKNMFGMASIVVGNAKKSGNVYFVNPKVNYKVNVNAFGADKIELWAGQTKLANTGATGLFTLPTSRIPGGLSYLTAKAAWSNGYTTVANVAVYRIVPLKFSTPAIAVSGRTVKVAGKVSGFAEANGSKAFAVRLSWQRLRNGRWVTAYSKTVRASSITGAYSGSYKVGAAGTWRVTAYHSDYAHPYASKATAAKAVK